MIYIYGIRVVLSVFYTFWRSYRGGETFPGSNSLWAKLPGAKPSLGEKVFGRNYRGRNLPWAKQSLGETTGGETVVGRNSRWAKMYWAKLPGAKQSLGETLVGRKCFGRNCICRLTWKLISVYSYVEKIVVI